MNFTIPNAADTPFSNQEGHVYRVPTRQRILQVRERADPPTEYSVIVNASMSVPGQQDSLCA